MERKNKMYIYEDLYKQTIRRMFSSDLPPEKYLSELEQVVERLRSNYEDCKIDNIDFHDWLVDEYRK